MSKSLMYVIKLNLILNRALTIICFIFPDPNLSSDIDQTKTIKTEPEPVFNLFRANSGSLNELLSNSVSRDASLDVSHTSSTSLQNDVHIVNNSIEEDCVMIGDSIPLPLESTTDDLTKQDEDVISENIPYNNTVS